MKINSYIHKPEIQISLLIAIALFLHGIFFLMGSYEKSYDAFTHIFLASHWQHDWFNSFEPRWYTGFSIFAYPPFAHQMVALFSFLIGLKAAFLLMLFATLAGIGLGMYRYTRLWFSHATSLLASGLVLIVPGLTMTTHLFGQYPNLVNLALTLNLLPYASRWLKGASHHELLKGELLLIAAACTSLFSNFLGVLFFVLPILFLPQDSEQTKQHQRRLALLLLIGFVTLFVCLLPFFSYIQSNPVEQVSIPHASRGDVLAWAKINYFTFYGLYGPQLLLLPILLYMGFKTRARQGFSWAILGLFSLSLGGSNPMNHWLLRGLFDVLTFDRFAFWNGVLMTPLLAQFCVSIWRKYTAQQTILRWLILSPMALLFLSFALLNMSSPLWKPLPRKLDTQAIAQHLESERFADHRFLTLGIGSYNLSSLSTWTSRQNIDGNYNLARRLPELNNSPIGQIDDAKYYGEEGLNTLAKLLLNPDKYHLNYIVLGDLFYTPLLQTCGWYQSEQLPDGLSLWTSSLPVSPIPEESPPISPLYWRLFWGLLPLSAFFGALLLIAFHKDHKQVET